MKSISLKLDEETFNETEVIRHRKKIARNKYLNEAIAHYNGVQERLWMAEVLKKESLMVRENSMEVLKEFEQLEDGDEAV
jgi:hypothetical protein